MKLMDVKLCEDTTAANIATTVVPLGKGMIIKRGDRKKKVVESNIATKKDINEIITEYYGDDFLQEKRKKLTPKQLEDKRQQKLRLFSQLQKILKNEHPEFSNINILIDTTALKNIFSPKDDRIHTNVIRFLEIIRDIPQPKEMNMISSKQMRAHRINKSKKNNIEFDKSVKVDIVGKDKGLLFHSGPKNVGSVTLSANDVYIVGFGSHDDLGT